MGTFTCWCGYVIRENDEQENCGHVLWDSVPGFYKKVAADLASFMSAKPQGTTGTWIRDYFESSIAPYEMTDAEVTEGIVYRVSEDWISGIYSCPNCRRVHLHIKGTENKWESFIPEGRVSGK